MKIAINSAVELGVGRCGQIRTLWAPVSKREREREKDEGGDRGEIDYHTSTQAPDCWQIVCFSFLGQWQAYAVKLHLHHCPLICP